MRMAPGWGWGARAVPATTTWTPGRSASTRSAAPRNAGQSRRTSCVRLPGNSPSTGRSGSSPSARRASARAGGGGRSRSGCPTNVAGTPWSRKNVSSNGRITARRLTAASRRTRAPGAGARGGAVATRSPRGGRARPPTARPPRRRCGARGSRPRVGEGRGLDGVRDAAGERQGLRPGGARHHDGFLAAHRAQEALELQLERLRFGGVEPHVLDDLLELGGADPLPPRPQPEEVPAPLRQVEGEIPRRLEDAELARALPGDAAGGDVGDGAVRELDARVRDVHMGREDRDAGGPHVAHVGAHELEHEVEVVDHEVENYGDVRAARLERGEAGELEEAPLRPGRGP